MPPFCFHREPCVCPNYKFWLFLFALVFILTCIGLGCFTVYYILKSSENTNSSRNSGIDDRYAQGTHHDVSVHEGWSNENSNPGKPGGEWTINGGIWSKSKEPSGGKEVIVKVKGDFVPGEHEVPERELPHGHSPMK